MSAYGSAAESVRGFVRERRTSLVLAACALAAAALVARGLLSLVLAPAAPPAEAFEAVSVARLWVEPDDGRAPVRREIASARHTLDVAMYLFTDEPLIEEVERASRRGVRVRVLLEQAPLGAFDGNRRIEERLDELGIAWRYGHPAYRYTHEKVIVVDGERALVMTSNLTRSAFTSNREYIALVSSPREVRDLAALFEADWLRTSYVPRSPGLVVSGDNSRGRLLALIGSAHREIELEAEVLEDARIERALVHASRRGVRVRVIAPMEEDLAPEVRDLSRSGVRVRLVASPYAHAKAILVDGERAYLGSVNFSAISLDQNREVGLITDTPSALRRLDAAFEEDWRSGTTP